MCSCAPPPPRPPLKLPTTILKECPGRRDLPLNVNLIGPIIVLSLAQRVAQFGKSGDLSCRKAEWKVADRWRRVRTSVRFVVLRPNWFSDNFHTFWREGIKQRVLAVLAGDGRSSFIDARDIASKPNSSPRRSEIGSSPELPPSAAPLRRCAPSRCGNPLK